MFFCALFEKIQYCVDVHRCQYYRSLTGRARGCAIEKWSFLSICKIEPMLICTCLSEHYLACHVAAPEIRVDIHC